MPEVKSEITAIEYRYRCDACGKADMRWTGQMSPGANGHKCEGCGHTVTLPARYPHTKVPGAYVEMPYLPKIV